MANNFLVYDAACEAEVNAFTALLNSGFLAFYTGGQPALDAGVTGTLLVTLTFSATAFASATASGGTVTANANTITSGTAGNSGTASYFVLLKSDGTTVCATGTVGTSGCDYNMNSTAIGSGGNVSCTAFQITMAQ